LVRRHFLHPLLLSAGLFVGFAHSLRAQAPADTMQQDSTIAGNPGAVDVAPGSGALGRLLGLGSDSGIRLGGVLVSNGNALLSGGNSPGSTSFNNLLVVDLQADLEKLAHIPGATFGAALLRFDGQPTNQQAGLITGYNGLPGAPPLDRTELYELWWRQSFFADKLIVRLGKIVPTFDFGNVTRPVPVQDPSLQIPTTSGLLCKRSSDAPHESPHFSLPLV
jgi:porin